MEDTGVPLADSGDASRRGEESPRVERDFGWLATVTSPKPATLWWNAAALAAILVALTPIIFNGQILMPDEGVYLKQAKVLAATGSWTSEHTTADFDPDGVVTGVSDSPLSQEGVISYHKHPLYPLLLAPAFSVAGHFGALAISILGTWCAAVSAAFVARRLKPDFGVWTLWLAGLGSPLFFDSYLVVAHTAAAALAGLAFLGVVRSLESAPLKHLSYALPAVAAAVALRGEGLMFAAALGGAVGLLAVGWPPLRRVDWRAAWTGGAVLAVGAAAFWLDRVAGGAIVEVASLPTQRFSNEAVNPLLGAWVSLFQPYQFGWENVTAAVPLAAIGVIVAAVCLRALPSKQLLPVVAVVGSAAAAVWMAVGRPSVVSGFFIVFPIGVFGVVWLRRTDFGTHTVRAAVTTVAIAAMGTLAVNYANGGATEWGGRFLHILLPLFVPLVVLGCNNAASELSPQARRIAFASLLIICLSFSIMSIRAQQLIRAWPADFVTAVVEAAAETGDDDIVVIPLRLGGDGSDRYFWDQEVDVVGSFGLSGLGPILTAVNTSDRDKALIFSDRPPAAIGFTLDTILKKVGWELTDARVTPEGSATIYFLERSEPTPG